MKKYIVKTTALTLPPLCPGLGATINKEFGNLEEAKRYGEKIKNFILDKEFHPDHIEYTEEEVEFLGGSHAVWYYDGIESIETIEIEGDVWIGDEVGADKK